jgi:MFS transporter, OPA family, glycerol-3-phosphate transporter
MVIKRDKDQIKFRRAQYRILFVTMFSYLFFYTGRQTMGFAIPGIEAEFGFQKDTIGWLITALLWSYAVGQAINGNLGDKYGGRILVSAGAYLSCGFNWIASFGMSFTGLLLPWIGNGLAQSMAWAPGSRVLTNWWSRDERGRVFGMYMLAAGLSSVLAYVTSLVILDTFQLNWRWIFRLPVILMLLGGTAYYLLVRNEPKDMGFKSPTDPSEKINRNTVEGRGGSATFVEETSIQRYLEVLKNWRFMLVGLAIGFQSSARYGLLFWVPVHFLGSDWKNSSSSWISIVLPIGMALGAVLGGWISDKLFKAVRWKLIVSFMTAAALATFSMYFLPKDSWLGIAVLFLSGFFAYGSQSAFWALAPDLLGKKRSGTGIGIMNFFAYLFAGLVNPLIGWVIMSNGQNTAMVFPIVGIACLITAGIGLIIKR